MHRAARSTNTRGELFLILGDLPRAEERQASRPTKICTVPCEELARPAGGDRPLQGGRQQVRASAADAGLRFDSVAAPIVRPCRPR